jgi:hypothetical protein
LESWLAFLEAQPQTKATIEGFQEFITTDAVFEHISNNLGKDVTPETPLRTLLTALWPDTDASVFTSNTKRSVPSMEHARSEHSFDSKLGEALENGSWEVVNATWPGLILTVVLRFAQSTGVTSEGWKWLR